MSAAPTITELDDELLDALAPPDAPSDDEVRDYLEALSYVDPEGHTPPTPTLPFAVRDLGSADWAGRKVAQAQAKVDEVRAWRDRVVAEADAAVAREEARQRPTVEFFEWHLTDWLRREIEADTSKKPRKSRDLPCGVTVKRTPGGKTLVYTDEAALVEWLDANYPECLNVSPRKAEVKTLLTKDGVKVPHVVIEESPDGYSVVVGGGR